jgi:hypothetical protein
MKLYALANLCPITVTLRTRAGYIDLYSQGAATAHTPHPPDMTTLDAGNLDQIIGFKPYQRPDQVYIPLMADEVEGIIVPLAVAEAMRTLGQRVRFQVFTPAMLQTDEQGRRFAPHLLHHADLTEVAHADG